jgi:hypothetical protein
MGAISPEGREKERRFFSSLSLRERKGPKRRDFALLGK